HMAAALDTIGGLPGVQEFPATQDGYARLLAWLRGFGAVHLAGIEGTGSYGAGLARHVAAAGSASSKSTDPTGKTAAARANRIRWTPAAPPGRLSPGGRQERREAGTGRWRRSAR